MKKYAYQPSARMLERVRDCMSRVCENYNIKESDYIRKCVEQTLVNYMQSRPEIFPNNNYYLTQNRNFYLCFHCFALTMGTSTFASDFYCLVHFLLRLFQYI